uniref:ADP-ribose pyrophosphatase, mitochondrial n=2 Tax=Cacopsylla melanoneura TaxID=428564 RepID=A0A8D8LNC4_9HEMI
MSSALVFGIVLISSHRCSSSSKTMVSTFNKIHSVCRSSHPYPRSEVQRVPVADDKVSWTIDHPEYKPVEFTQPFIHGQVWADEDITPENKSQFKWNTLDEHQVNRVGHNGVYTIDPDSGRPRNPFGRTGLSGRGSLGRWGPNHAADPLVTRWMKNEEGEVVKDPESGKPRLEFLAIQRRVGKMWALPGGMVDKGEQALDTAQRELCEEALNSSEWNLNEDKQQKHLVSELFAKSEPVYKGYIDDARNTDNAWMETVALHAHDPTGSNVAKLNLIAGDDAVDVKWMPVEAKTTLFANHNDLIRIVAHNMDAHWSNEKDLS